MDRVVGRRSAVFRGQGRRDGSHARCGRELAGKGIRVNAIAPSVIYNEFLERIYPKSMFENAKKRNPMGRLGEPSEVANLALFLASDMSSYITGEVIAISGGSIVVP